MLHFLLACFLLAVLPGPDILFVVAQSVGRGFKTAFAVSLGLVSGLFVHTALVALGVGALVTASPVSLFVMKCAGAAYLGWLGFCAVRAKPEPAAKPCAALDLNAFGKCYKRGVIMNLLNPKVIIFFLSFLPGFLPPETKHVCLGLFGLGGIFAAVSLGVFSAVSWLGGWLNGKLDIGRYASSRGFAWTSACIFWFIGGWIAWR